MSSLRDEYMLPSFFYRHVVPTGRIYASIIFLATCRPYGTDIYVHHFSTDMSSLRDGYTRSSFFYRYCVPTGRIYTFIIFLPTCRPYGTDNTFIIFLPTCRPYGTDIYVHHFSTD